MVWLRAARPAIEAASWPTWSCTCAYDRCGRADGADTYLNMINNKDVGADCDPATKQCNIQIQDFPIQLQTPCSAGDCVSDKNPTLNSGEPTAEHNCMNDPAHPVTCLLSNFKHA